MTRADSPGDPVGFFYAWWRGDRLPELPPLAGLAIEAVEDEAVIASATGRDAEAVRARIEQGHRPYLACLAGVPVAYGWSATREAEIGGIEIAFTIPAGNRYLWDFVTEPAQRGRGLYPRRLLAILARESAEADRFWIGHDRENDASARGILRAGFGRVGALHALHGGWALLPAGPPERARAGARLLGVDLLEQAVGRRSSVVRRRGRGASGRAPDD
jgi:hypothetical protein